MVVVGGHSAYWGAEVHMLDSCQEYLISLYDMNTKEVILSKKSIEMKSNI